MCTLKSLVRLGLLSSYIVPPMHTVWRSLAGYFSSLAVFPGELFRALHELFQCLQMSMGLLTRRLLAQARPACTQVQAPREKRAWSGTLSAPKIMSSELLHCQHVHNRHSSVQVPESFSQGVCHLQDSVPGCSVRESLHRRSLPGCGHLPLCLTVKDAVAVGTLRSGTLHVSYDQ